MPCTNTCTQKKNTQITHLVDVLVQLLEVFVALLDLLTQPCLLCGKLVELLRQRIHCLGRQAAESRVSGSAPCDGKRCKRKGKNSR